MRTARGRLSRGAWLAAAHLLAAAAAGAQTSPPPPGLPRALRDVAFEQRLGEMLPLDVALRDEAGRTVRLGDYFGRRPVVLSLVYYECPMLCTLTLNGLVSALGVLTLEPGREFELVTVSFDPRDTPERAATRKQAYLSRYRKPGAESAWHFLSAEPDAIARITDAVGFRYAWDAETRQFAHPAGVVVATPDGRISRYLYGIEYAPKDLRLALVEASAGSVGRPVDRLLLFCYQYDPATGGYGVAIMRIVRLGGIATVLALAGFITMMLRRERALARGAPASGRAG